MRKHYIQLNLDFAETKTLQIVRAKQYENGGRVVRIKCYDNGIPLTLGSETVTYNASINNAVLSKNVPCTVTSDGEIELPLTSDLLVDGGSLIIEVVVKTGSTTIATASFEVQVESSPIDERKVKYVSAGSVIQRLEKLEESLLSQEQAISAVDKTITKFILNGISALHPEYTRTLFSEEVETEDDITMTMVLDLSSYNPDKSDGLLLTADDVLISPLAYAATIENNAAIVRIFESAGLSIGQTVKAYVYHKPKSSGGTLAGQATTVLQGSVVKTTSGIAQIIEDTEEEEAT